MRLRALPVGQYAIDHYAAQRGLAVSTLGLVADLAAKVRICRPGVTVADLGLDLLDELHDHFAAAISLGQIEPSTANKYLRLLRAVTNHAADDRLVKRVRYRQFFKEKMPKPTTFDDDQRRRIEERCLALEGMVAGVPAAVWWTAWWRCIGWAGCRLSAMMLAERGDFQHGVLWLREENQKQGENQRIALPRRSVAAIENLLAAHDDPRLFPWPFDRRRPGKRTNWKTLFDHFSKRILTPVGITLPKGVKTKMCRRTAASLAKKHGGSGQRLCGHKSAATTDKFYIPGDQGAVIQDALLIPEVDRPVQLNLFERDTL